MIARQVRPFAIFMQKNRVTKSIVKEIDAYTHETIETAILIRTLFGSESREKLIPCPGEQGAIKGR